MKTQWNTKPGPVRKINQIEVNITKYNQIEVVIFLFFVLSTRKASFQPLSSSAFAANSSCRPRSLATNLCRNADLPPRRRVTPNHIEIMGVGRGLLILIAPQIQPITRSLPRETTLNMLCAVEILRVRAVLWPQERIAFYDRCNFIASPGRASRASRALRFHT